MNLGDGPCAITRMRTDWSGGPTYIPVAESNGIVLCAPQFCPHTTNLPKRNATTVYTVVVFLWGVLMLWENTLATLRSDHGYKGDGSLESVKSFVNEGDGIDLVGADDKPLDLDSAFAEFRTSKRKTARVDDTPTPPARSAPAIHTSKAARSDAAGYNKMDGDGQRHEYSRKAYNQKANSGKTIFPDADVAEAFGAYVRYATLKNINPDYGQRQSDVDILNHFGIKTLTTTTGTAAGFTIPEDLNRFLIDIRTNYGVLSPYLRRERQSQNLQSHMRQTGDLTVYQVGEGSSGTASDMAFDLVSVTATKLGCRTLMTNEILNDSALNLADVAARNILWSFEKRLEECVVQGDGTSTYYGMTGFCGNATNIGGAFAREVVAGGGTWTTDGDKDNLSGVVVAAGNTFAEVTALNLDQMTAQASNSNARNAYFCSRPFYAQVFQRLTRTSGVSVPDVTGRMVPSWNGYPIIMVESMAKSDTNSQVACLFGDLGRASIVGEVGGIQIRSSDTRYIEEDSVVMVGFHRVGLTVHDVGNYNATIANHVGAPVVGLAMANA